MGVPVMEINFEQLAATAVTRSSRGTVALLLEDSTANGAAKATYKKAGDVPASGQWSADNQKYIKLALKGGAASVMAVRVAMTDGQTPAANYAATLAGVRNMGWDWLAAPSATADNVGVIAAWVEEVRGDGATHKAILANASAPDCEGVVNFCTSGIKTTIGGEAAATAYTTGEYTAYLAGMLAGAPLNQSLTGRELLDVTEITESADPDADVDAGKLILRWNGAAHEIVSGVTSLVTTTGVPALFKKIKHVEGCDLLAKDIAALFKANYKGKRVNSYANKQQLVAEIIAYFSQLTGSVLSPDYANVAAVDFDTHRSYLAGKGVAVDTMTDIAILQGNTDEKVYLRADVQLIDAMESMYFTVALN